MRGFGSLEKPKITTNLGLRITLVNAYCHFYSSHIIMFVIGFSRSRHISDFQSSPYASTTPHHVFALLFGFAQISGSSIGPVGGQLPPSAPPLPVAMLMCAANTDSAVDM